MNYFLKAFEKKNSIYIFKYLILSIAIVIFIEGISFFLNLEEPKSSKIEERFFSNLIWSCIGAIFFSPLLEEVAFRLPLQKTKYFVISIVTCFIFLLSSNFFYHQVTIALFIVMILVNQFENKFCPRLTKVLLVSFSIMSFVIIHFDNYDIEELKLLKHLEIVFLFMPQFVISIILTKVRLETSFANTIIIHSLYNLIILTLAFFLTINTFYY